ncbi:MAG: hypothetical protein JW841_13655 [Deltaproteobacteria bacterium]|nr:hypothetical protein [Deltaproteobacteria bacterium]
MSIGFVFLLVTALQTLSTQSVINAVSITNSPLTPSQILSVERQVKLIGEVMPTNLCEYKQAAPACMPVVVIASGASFFAYRDAIAALLEKPLFNDRLTFLRPIIRVASPDDLLKKLEGAALLIVLDGVSLSLFKDYCTQHGIITMSDVISFVINDEVDGSFAMQDGKTLLTTKQRDFFKQRDESKHKFSFDLGEPYPYLALPLSIGASFNKDGGDFALGFMGALAVEFNKGGRCHTKSSFGLGIYAEYLGKPKVDDSAQYGFGGLLMIHRIDVTFGVVKNKTAPQKGNIYSIGFFDQFLRIQFSPHYREYLSVMVSLPLDITSFYRAISCSHFYL